MASSLGRIASQSVHITTSPNPRSLAESKLVLAALQKFGEVVTFRNLKYDTTNTSKTPSRGILAIFESPDSATRAIEASPLTIALPSAAAASETSKRPQILKCDLQPSHHNHESALRRNPFHTMFHVSSDSYHHRDLVHSGIPLQELADEPMGRKRHMPLRMKRKIQAENERLGATSLMRLYREGLELEQQQQQQRGPGGGEGSVGMMKEEGGER